MTDKLPFEIWLRIGNRYLCVCLFLVPDSGRNLKSFLQDRHSQLKCGNGIAVMDIANSAVIDADINPTLVIEFVSSGQN